LGLPENFHRQGLLDVSGGADALPPITGPAAVLSGSCSEATRAQLAYIRERAPVFKVDPIAAAAGRNFVGEALNWATSRLGDRPIVISATAPPEEVAAIQKELGRDRAGALVEETLAAIARGLVAKGARRLILAGGETAGAIVQALGVTGLRIGRQIDPGVPWTMSLGDPTLALALKSGNFGAPDFFLRAFSVLDEVQA